MSNHPVIRLSGDELVSQGVPSNAQFLAAAMRYEERSTEVRNDDGTTRIVTELVPTGISDFYFVIRRDMDISLSYASMKEAAKRDLAASSEAGRELFQQLAGFAAPTSADTQ